MLEYTEKVFRHLYAKNIEGEWLTYSRRYFDGDWSLFDRRADYVRNRLRGQGRNILVVGAGFGFLVERLVDMGFRCWGIEPSPYVWDNVEEIRPDVRRLIVNGRIGVDDVSVDLRMAGAPRRFTHVIDEDVITSLDDSEMPDFIEALERLGTWPGNIIHFFTPLQSPAASPLINWKSGVELAALAPDHTWLQEGSEAWE